VGGGEGGTSEAARAAAALSQSDASTYAVTRTAPVTSDDRAFRKKRFQLLWAARLSTVRYVMLRYPTWPCTCPCVGLGWVSYGTGGVETGSVGWDWAHGVIVWNRPGILTIDVRRKYVLSDSLAALDRFKPAELQRRLVIKFREEDGIDGGGLTKDWCLLLSRCVSRVTCVTCDTCFTCCGCIVAVVCAHFRWCRSSHVVVLLPLFVRTFGGAVPLTWQVWLMAYDVCTVTYSKACSDRVGLFVRSSSGHLDVNPNVLFKRRGVHTMRLLGRFIGKAVFARHLVDFPLSTCLCLRLTGKTPSLADLQVRVRWCRFDGGGDGACACTHTLMDV